MAMGGYMNGHQRFHRDAKERSITHHNLVARGRLKLQIPKRTCLFNFASVLVVQLGETDRQPGQIRHMATQSGTNIGAMVRAANIDSQVPQAPWQQWQ